MILDGVPTILALYNPLFERLSLGLNARLRKHEAWAYMVRLMASNIKCAII